MKQQNSKLFLMTLLFTAIICDASILRADFNISISLPRNSFKIGEPIVAHVSLKNISKEKIIVARANGPQQAQFNYKITMLDESGHIVPLKSSIHRPRQIEKPLVWSNVAWDLAPNEKLEEDCVITELFLLDKPGKYVLAFDRWIPNSDKIFVHSNTLTFNIAK
jgi:hypothetical protein